MMQPCPNCLASKLLAFDKAGAAVQQEFRGIQEYSRPTKDLFGKKKEKSPTSKLEGVGWTSFQNSFLLEPSQKNGSKNYYKNYY